MMMTAPRIPTGETRRLEALRALEVLDTGVEERFDRLTRLAGRLFEVPIAALSLVDENREWFKTCVGVEGREGERATSFCGHTILEDDTLVIPDAAADPRFADNPQVTGDGIRFYAGHPLRAPGGERIGALCIKDRRPRELSPPQIESLRELAAIAEAELHIPERDVTAEALAMAQLQEAKDHLDALVASAVDGIITVAIDGAIRTYNPAAETIFGYRPEEVIGGSIKMLMPEPMYSASPAQLQRFMEAELPREGGVLRQMAGRRKDGSVFPLELAVSVMGSGETRHFLGITRDVTDRRRNERRLREAKRAAEIANQTKTDFLASMSHELRTPLNSVIGFANVLLKNKDGRLGETQLNYLDRIRDNGTHLLQLINDVLDISKIEAGRRELERSSVDLNELARQTLAESEGQAHQKALLLKLDLPMAVVPVDTDERALKQVLINLVGNAIKFTEQGHVLLRVLADRETGRPTALEVEDTGIGIAEDLVDTIFEPFHQAESGTARRFGGTGLGLAISRSLCGLLGYRLGVESTVGVGSTFRVTLTEQPAAVAPVFREAVSGEEPPAHSLAGAKVLVIDDASDVRLLLTQHLEDLGGRVRSAPSGQLGLRLAREFRPDLITLDLQMPGMDGWQVLRRLKEDSELASIPVVILQYRGRRQPGQPGGGGRLPEQARATRRAGEGAEPVVVPSSRRSADRRGRSGRADATGRAGDRCRGRHRSDGASRLARQRGLARARDDEAASRHPGSHDAGHGRFRVSRGIAPRSPLSRASGRRGDRQGAHSCGAGETRERDPGRHHQGCVTGLAADRDASSLDAGRRSDRPRRLSSRGGRRGNVDASVDCGGRPGQSRIARPYDAAVGV